MSANSDDIFHAFLYKATDKNTHFQSWIEYDYPIIKKYSNYDDACIGLINILKENLIETHIKCMSAFNKSKDHEYSTLPDTLLSKYSKNYRFKSGKYISIGEREYGYNSYVYFGIVVDNDVNCMMKDIYDDYGIYNNDEMYEEVNEKHSMYNVRIIHENWNKCFIWSIFDNYSRKVIRHPIEPKRKYKKCGMSNKYTQKYIEYLEKLEEFNEWYDNTNNVPIIIPIQRYCSDDELLNSLFVEFHIGNNVAREEYKMKKRGWNNNYFHDPEHINNMIETLRNNRIDTKYDRTNANNDNNANNVTRKSNSNTLPELPRYEELNFE